MSFGNSRPLRIHFKLENVFKGALGALDLRTQHCLLPDIHGDEEVRVWENGRDSVQSAQGSIRFRREPAQFRIDFDGWIRRQWSGDEGLVTGCLFYISSSAHNMQTVFSCLFYRTNLSRQLHRPYFTMSAYGKTRASNGHICFMG